MDGVEPRLADGTTLGAYVAAFGPTLPLDELIRWPADVFALTNLLLDHSEAYRDAVSPPPGRRWPPRPDWGDLVAAVAQDWREQLGTAGPGVPPAVGRCWDLVRGQLDRPLAALRGGALPDLSEALLTLHAITDEVHGSIAAPGPHVDGAFEEQARAMLATDGSLSHLDPDRIRVLPKTQLSARGLTIRSFSRYLALSYESVELEWSTVEVGAGTWEEGREYHMLLVPWPLHIDGHAFREVEGPLDMDPERFGFFTFDPGRPTDLGFLEEILDAAAAQAPRIDSVVFPECALHAEEVAPIEALLADRGIPSLVAGVRQEAVGHRLSRNYVHLGFDSPGGWIHLEQDKHHRWFLDGAQIRQYGLSRALSPKRLWWEAIVLPPRRVRIVDTGVGATMAPLICEDLARLDEVSDVLRRIGPSFVLGLLLDGPQLSQRWACRYSSVLADDPGSAVLTLSSFGMVTRSRPPGVAPSRAVAMWSDPTTGSHRLELGHGAAALLATSTVGSATVWTADGRRHDVGQPSSVLSSVRQVRPARGASRRGFAAVAARG